MGRKPLAVGPFLAASCFLLAGCSGSGRPTIAPVSGHVIYKGQPVADATVVFLCPGAPRLAVGTTDKDGNYQLTTYEPNDGAVIGTHTVTVKKFKNEPAATDPAAGAAIEMKDSAALSKAIEKSMHEAARQAAKAEKSGSVLPAKYAQFKTSDLHREVVDGPNVINLELTD
jgi:hypothetical protein